MMTIEQVQQKCKELCELAEVELTVPVEMNNRLTATLGRVMYWNYDLTKPKKIEFSTKFFQNAAEADCLDVIRHEVAHYVVTVRTGERHGHDSVFKAVCVELGGTRETGKCQHKALDNQTQEYYNEGRNYKYVVFCPNCGFIGGYKRMAGHLKHLGSCNCGKCGSNGLYYKQNY